MSLGRGGGGGGQGGYGGGGSQGNYPGSHPGRRSREERRSLSESLADGTSKFFSSMVAKKNGLFNDISSKLENTFAPKTDTISNSTTGSERSSPTTPPPPNTPPPRPPPPKRLPSLGNAREKEKENVIRRMASVPTYTRSDQWSDGGQDVTQPRGHLVNHKGANSDDRISVNGMNISFDEPILYNTREATTVHTSSAPDNQGNRKNVASIERDTIVTSSTPPQPRPAPRSQKASSNDAQQRYSLPSNYGQSARHYEEDTRQSKMTYEQRLLDEVKQMSNEVIKLTESVQRSDESLESCPRSGDKKPDSDSGASDSADDSHARKKAPMFTNTKRRSSTVDEMLFDDYVEPVVDPVVILPDEPPENLICFETEPDPSLLIKSPDSSLDDDQCKVTAGTSIDSSDVEYGGSTVHRSGSVGSDKSCSSNYSIDSQPDDVTLTCVEFMKLFVDKVFRER
uniref:Uncharacterized protein n=1 Tax=Biomphalaria glabrata TaxID=6526 RepID=A0A2C9KSM6_BIOGL